jgi:hypothetical protein
VLDRAVPMISSEYRPLPGSSVPCPTQHGLVV